MPGRSVAAANDIFGTVESNLIDRTDHNRVDSQNFLKDWVTNKLPEYVTGLAIRVVDDGSGSLAKEAMDMGQDKGFFNRFFGS